MEVVFQIESKKKKWSKLSLIEIQNEIKMIITWRLKIINFNIVFYKYNTITISINVFTFFSPFQNWLVVAVSVGLILRSLRLEWGLCWDGMLGVWVWDWAIIRLSGEWYPSVW